MRSSWSWSHGSCISKYLCNQCLSPLMLWVLIPLRRGVLNTTLYDKVCLWLVTDQWFSPVSSTNKTDHRDITEILLKVVMNTINYLNLKTYSITIKINLRTVWWIISCVDLTFIITWTAVYLVIKLTKVITSVQRCWNKGICVLVYKISI